MKILFVCTGNICRSPTAEGVLRHHADGKLTVDSAGTHAYHVGEAPDSRSINAARKRGIDISGQRARKVGKADFQEFDLILACDREHLAHLHMIAPDNTTAKLSLFLEYAGHPQVKEVPDPYYGGAKDFELVLDLVEAGVQGLLHKLEK